MTTSDVLSNTPYLDNTNVKQYLWGILVPMPFPSVLDRSQLTNRYMLNPGTTKFPRDGAEPRECLIEVRTARQKYPSVLP